MVDWFAPGANMRTVLLLALAALLFSGCTATPAPAATAAAVIEAKPALAHGTGGLEGYVVDESFAPIVGATVEVQGLGRTLTVNSHGYYFTGGITPGVYGLTANADRFEPHSQKATAAVGEIGLYVFVLRTMPGADAYTVTKLHSGMVACALALAPVQSTQSEGGSQVNRLDADCSIGVPSLGQSRNQGGRGADTNDRSTHRWTLDEPHMLWDSAKLITRWTATHDFVRSLHSQLGVDGCSDEERSFESKMGPSPIIQSEAEAEVERILKSAQGTTCTSPGERCDADACVLSSRVRPAAQNLAMSSAGFGFAFQQAFDQEFTAVFALAEPVEGQTLK